MHAKDIAVIIALFLESLVVVAKLTAAVSDCDSVTCNCSDDLKLSSCFVGDCVSETNYTDIDEAACDVCKSVRLTCTFNMVELDAENALKLTEEECVGTCSWHTSVDHARISLCICNELLECVVWSIHWNSEDRVAVVIESSDECQVLKWVYVTVSRNILCKEGSCSEHDCVSVWCCVLYSCVALCVLHLLRIDLKAIDSLETFDHCSDCKVCSTTCGTWDDECESVVCEASFIVSGCTCRCFCSALGKGEGNGSKSD